MIRARLPEAISAPTEASFAQVQSRADVSIACSGMRCLRALVIITWSAAAPLPAHAEVAQGLTLQEALARALEGHPSLIAANEDVNAATVRIREAQLRPPLELGLDLENFAGSDEVSGTDALETTLQMSRALELGGKRERRTELAQTERDSAIARLDVVRLDLVTEVTARFLEVLAAQEELAVAERFLTLARETRTQAQRRVAAGNALSAEAHRARAEVGRQEAIVAEIQGKLVGARRALAASWGGTQEVGFVVGDLRATSALESVDSLLKRLDESPRLAVLTSEGRIHEAERRLAQTYARPDITLAFGLRRLNEIDDTGLVASALLPLGNRSRSRVRVAASEAQIRRSAAEQEAFRQGMRASISALHGAIEARRRSLQILESDVRPAAEMARRQIERGYRLGRLPYGEYALATRDALQAELEAIRIATDYHQLRNRLEGLIGAPVRNATPELTPAPGAEMEIKP